MVQAVIVLRTLSLITVIRACVGKKRILHGNISTVPKHSPPVSCWNLAVDLLLALLLLFSVRRNGDLWLPHFLKNICQMLLKAVVRYVATPKMPNSVTRRRSRRPRTLDEYTYHRHLVRDMV